MATNEQLNKIAAKIKLGVKLTDKESALWKLYGPRKGAKE